VFFKGFNMRILPFVSCLVLSVGVMGCQASSLFPSKESAVLSYSPSPQAVDEVEIEKAAQPNVSPLDQHMKARGDVDPSKVNRKNSYSKTVADYEAEQDRIDRQVQERINSPGYNAKRVFSQKMAENLKIEPEPLSGQYEQQERAKSYVQQVLEQYQARKDSSEADAVEEDLNRAVLEVKAQDKKQDNKDIEVVNKVADKKSMASKVSASVTDVRIGEHKDKTRIVLDLSDKTDYQAEFTNAGRVLNVELSRADWKTDKTYNVNGKSLIESYAVIKSDDGHVLRVQLKTAAEIGYESVLTPSKGYGNRIVLDLVAK